MPNFLNFFGYFKGYFHKCDWNTDAFVKRSYSRSKTKLC